MRLHYTEDGKDAGVSVVVGFILIVAILMIGVTLYQQQVIPDQERTTEVQHHRTAINQLQTLQTSVLQASSGQTESVTFKPGVRYGGASFFIHSPPAAGKVQITQFSTNIQIENAQGSDQSSVFWDAEGEEVIVGDGGDGNGVQYNASYLTFTPQYYHFQNAPKTRLVYGHLFKDYSNIGVSQQVMLSNQHIVEGDDINLVMLGGDISTASVGTLSMRIHPVSASTNSISIKSPTGNNNPIRIHIPTILPLNKWTTLFSGETCEGGEPSLTDTDTNCNEGGGDGHIAELSMDTSPPGPEKVLTITFEQGSDITYDLKMSKLFLTTESSTQEPPTTEALYAAWSGTNDITIRESSTVSIPATAVDKYNNPVDGERVVGEAVTRSGGGNWPNNCIGGFESAGENPDSFSCNGRNGGTGGTNFYQRGLEYSNNNGDIVFAYTAPEVNGDIQVEFRVCLRKYLAVAGGPAQSCGDVSQNDNRNI